MLRYGVLFIVPKTPNLVFFEILPIVCPASIVPRISPGFPLVPLLILRILVVTNSPFAIFINSAVSISIIPCPNVANIPEDGS